MVKRTPPLAVAVIGTGEATPKVVESILSDYTAPYADVTFVLPVADDYWSPTLDSVVEWITANDIPYVAVTSGSGVGKALQPVLEGADNTIKVARISTKVVQLLQQEKAEGDVALLVAWDDDDEEAVVAVNKALSSEIRAFNLLDGLDEFTFDEDDEDEPVEVPSADATPDPDEDEAPAAAKVGDEYDDWGIRKLRAALRERSEEHDIPDRTIGQLEKDDAIRALRNIDNGRGKAATKEAEAAVESDPEETPEEPVAHSRQIADKIKGEQTTRARRAFAEGVAEATGQDEAQVDLPNSKAGDLLSEQNEETDEAQEIADELVAAGQAAIETGLVEDTELRVIALQAAAVVGSDPNAVLTAARRFEAYLKGAAPAPGRPRKDGSPAQPREINPETGKPVRRRSTS